MEEKETHTCGHQPAMRAANRVVDPDQVCGARDLPGKSKITNPQKLKVLRQRVASAPPRMKTIPAGSWRFRGQSSAARGYGYAWQQAREAFLRRHPLCVFCELAGRVTAATVVDHSIPHRGDMTLFWQQEHWQALCKAHHDSQAQRRDNGI